MLARDVPKVRRSSPELSSAYEQGCEAGRKGVAAEGNPWMGDTLRGIAVGCRAHYGHSTHACRTRTRDVRAYYAGRTYCGAGATEVYDDLDFSQAYNRCLRCVRSVQAERKRLASAWESGRMEFHPK